MRKGFISIVVSTKNEAAVLPDCLRSIGGQSIHGYEIIVVDNNSTDETAGIAAAAHASVYIRGPERSAQRNYGAQKANGEFFLFLDADMELEKNVLSQAVDQLKNPDIEAVIIPELSVGEGFWARCKALERSFYVGVDWLEAARFFRRSAFEELGGYDEKMTGPEDFDLPQRLVTKYGKRAVGRTTSFIVHHEGRLSLRELIRKKYYYGKSMREYTRRQTDKTLIRKQANILNRYGLFLTRPEKLFQHPIVSAGMIVMKTFEIAAIAFGTLRGKA